MGEKKRMSIDCPLTNVTTRGLEGYRRTRKRKLLLPVSWHCSRCRQVSNRAVQGAELESWEPVWAGGVSQLDRYLSATHGTRQPLDRAPVDGIVAVAIATTMYSGLWDAAARFGRVGKGQD